MLSETGALSEFECANIAEKHDLTSPGAVITQRGETICSSCYDTGVNSSSSLVPMWRVHPGVGINVAETVSKELGAKKQENILDDYLSGWTQLSLIEKFGTRVGIVVAMVAEILRHADVARAGNPDLDTSPNPKRQRNNDGEMVNPPKESESEIESTEAKPEQAKILVFLKSNPVIRAMVYAFGQVFGESAPVRWTAALGTETQRVKAVKEFSQKCCIKLCFAAVI